MFLAMVSHDATLPQDDIGIDFGMAFLSVRQATSNDCLWEGSCVLLNARYMVLGSLGDSASVQC